jgi:hypothetical protein
MRRLAFALIVLIALSAAVWLWMGRAPSTRIDAVAPTADGSARTNARLQAPAVEGSTAAARSAVLQPAASTEGALASQAAALEVRVELQDQGTPVESAEVLARGSQGAQEIELRGRTDAAGTCRLEHASSFVAQSVAVLATEATSAERLWLDRGWVGAGRTLPVTVLVSEGGTLVGRVVGDDGAPIAGARVLGWCGSHFEPLAPPQRQTQSDELGRFELAHLGASFSVIAESPGLACAQGLRGTLAPGQRADADGELELVLRPVTTVRGRVIGAKGEPVAARVRFQEVGFGSSNDHTDAIGVERAASGGQGCAPRAGGAVA